MRNHKAGLLALALAAATGPAFSVTPQQEGTYSGSMSLKVYDITGKIGSRKLLMLMQLGTDHVKNEDVTTVTLNGIPQVSGQGSSIYGASEGIVLFNDLDGKAVYLASVHMKGTSIKGSVTGFRSIDTQSTALTETYEGKLTLKKLP